LLAADAIGDAVLAEEAIGDAVLAPVGIKLRVEECSAAMALSLSTGSS
jgi:hypothetical protein